MAEGSAATAPSVGPPILDVAGLDVSYGRLQVLFGVDLQVAEGETLALLGTNGAGKSTLLRAISGLVEPDAGEISLDGKSLLGVGADGRVRLGLVQVAGGKATFGGLTVDENLAAGAYTIRRNRALVAERRQSVLELFPDLAERPTQAAWSLSGGQQQMLALAKALMLDPRILLIDEFSLGLAPKVVAQLMEVVERLERRGKTLIIVEQSVNVALAMAQRAVFMEKGEVRFEGPAQELLEREDIVRAVFLGAK
jgi:ABC-type branched-subunit amino acid transport system ATPase component